MAIVTFWNGTREQCGVTSASLAVATHMAIEHNMKILLISTSLNDTTMKDSFWLEKKKSMLGLFGQDISSNIMEQSGIEGLDRIIRSNKLTVDTITDYTNIVLKDRLELLLGVQGNQAVYDSIKDRYAQILPLANQYYDMIFIDLDERLDLKNQEEILKQTDVVVAVIPQKTKEINKVQKEMQNGAFIRRENTIPVIGKYMKDTKYNAKNISRSILGQKEMVNIVPYNNLFFEAMQEGKLIDLFLNLMRLKDTTDDNYQFIEEIKRLSQNIREKIKSLPRRR